MATKAKRRIQPKATKAAAKVATKAKAKVTPRVASARKSAAGSAFKHWADGSSAYHGVRGDTRAVLICAAFVVAGFAKVSKTTVTKAGKGNRGLFVELVGSTPWNHHRNEKRIVDGELTAEGIKWFQHRITSPERLTLVGELVTAMTKGGSAGGLSFTHKVTA